MVASMAKRNGLVSKLEAVLKREFPAETVDVTPSGVRDNVHVVVVSRRFDGMTEPQKQDFLWSIIDRSNLSKAEKLRITMLLPVSPRELH